MSPGNTERLLELIKHTPGLDDDELSRISGVQPRQQVNQICRRLEGRGLIRRIRGRYGKIVNLPARAGMEAEGEFDLRGQRTATSVHVQPTELPKTKAGIRRDWHIEPLRAETDLLILPCSGSKRSCGGASRAGPSLLDALPHCVATRLAEARTVVSERASLDETSLLPAWQRYTGTLYAAAGSALKSLLDRGVRVLILSGGYGVVLAEEPIGTYEAVFKSSWWPKMLLQNVLVNYAQRHKISRMRALVSLTTSYRKIIETTAWREAGVKDAIIISPEAATGAMVKAPRAQGEALAALTGKGLSSRWRSSDGLALIAHQNRDSLAENASAGGG